MLPPVVAAHSEPNLDTTTSYGLPGQSKPKLQPPAHRDVLRIVTSNATEEAPLSNGPTQGEGVASRCHSGQCIWFLEGLVVSIVAFSSDSVQHRDAGEGRLRRDRGQAIEPSSW